MSQAAQDKPSEGSPSARFGSCLSDEILGIYLDKGFAVSTEEFSKEYRLHPQDVSLISAVADAIIADRTSIIVAPFISSWDVAFLIRALTVATVRCPSLCLYSADQEVRKRYRSLSYIANRVKEPMSKVHPLHNIRQDGRVVHCSTLRELSEISGPTILIVDARNTRGWRNLNKAPWESVVGPKVFLALLEDDRLLSLLPNAGTVFCRGCNHTIEEWPDSLRPARMRLNNYSRGINLVPETIPGTGQPFAALERAFQRLITNTKGLDQVQGQLAQARRLNHFVQNSILPLSISEQAAHGIGQYWIEGMLSSVKAASAFEIPVMAKASFRNFALAASQAMNALSLNHPPKVAWFKRFLLERKEPVFVYCGTHIEQLAMEYWSNSKFAEACAKTIIVTRSELRYEGFTSEIIIPGPPSEEDLSHLLGGVSSNVRVLVYSWQAKHWNILSKRLSNLMSQVQPLPEPPEEEIETREEGGISWVVPSQDSDEGEDVLEKEFSSLAPANILLIRTDAGMLQYEEDAMVPTLEVDRFVDRQAKLLQKGDTIILRTGGNLIDSRRTVDALATTNPLLAEAAEEASIWRKFLGTYVKSQQMSYRQIHAKLFPNNEVTYSTVRGWVLNHIKVGPHNDNLALLLTRIGASQEKIKEMIHSVHVYRSYRARVYRHLYKLWNNYAGKIYEIEGEKADIDDERIDAEFGLSLASLEQLITFAKVLERPTLKGGARP